MICWRLGKLLVADGERLLERLLLRPGGAGGPPGGRGLARGRRRAALCANACLLARALERSGQPVFADGGRFWRG